MRAIKIKSGQVLMFGNVMAYVISTRILENGKISMTFQNDRREEYTLAYYPAKNLRCKMKRVSLAEHLRQKRIDAKK